LEALYVVKSSQKGAALAGLIATIVINIRQQQSFGIFSHLIGVILK
jgi:hypothetical protein